VQLGLSDERDNRIAATSAIHVPQPEPHRAQLKKTAHSPQIFHDFCRRAQRLGLAVPSSSTTSGATKSPDAPQKWSFPLPLFYFHIISDNTFLDDEGTNFESEQDAMKHARELAAELVRTTGTLRGAILVENEDAGGMFEVPLSSWNN
jgi:hypothetical protein